MHLSKKINPNPHDNSLGNKVENTIPSKPRSRYTIKLQIKINSMQNNSPVPYPIPISQQPMKYGIKQNPYPNSFTKLQIITCKTSIIKRGEMKMKKKRTYELKKKWNIHISRFLNLFSCRKEGIFLPQIETVCYHHFLFPRLLNKSKPNKK